MATSAPSFGDQTKIEHTFIHDQSNMELKDYEATDYFGGEQNQGSFEETSNQ